MKIHKYRILLTAVIIDRQDISVRHSMFVLCTVLIASIEEVACCCRGFYIYSIYIYTFALTYRLHFTKAIPVEKFNCFAVFRSDKFYCSSLVNFIYNFTLFKCAVFVIKRCNYNTVRIAVYCNSRFRIGSQFINYIYS